ncbi:hemolysin family protein [Pseudooceanicola sp.]|uniref:hemolysin family protein n=1 Tax=Pseudooceanicola sp. TaxID=1914328 RepID=UPI00260A7644|nr:hemolysin family protein [Pseudooceanicola sp.]MDF1855992.1 hemolysin family protein [Pseudooceanicola sp.]
MGDTTDGSLTAAQGALPQGQTTPAAPAPNSAPSKLPDATPAPAPRRSFLSRLFARRGTSVPEAAHLATPAPTLRPAHGMGNLRRMRVEDVSIPKADIVAVPSTITRDDLVKVFRDSGMTRVPVYQDTLDTPIGFVHLKDFALKHGFNGPGGGRYSLKALLRPLLFVPPSMPIGVLLQKMQQERRHMALVIDEYGGVDGLVTIEDLIEQVIGQIEDEHDIEEGALWTHEPSGSWLVYAKTPLDEFEAESGVSLTDHDSVDEEEIDTLGGLVFMLSGRVPARGEVVEHPAGHEFEVIDADPRRIKRLRVRLHATAANG